MLINRDELEKNAYGNEGKMLQPPPDHNHEPPFPTAYNFQPPVSMQQACGCCTWKHERRTDECLPMAEQELAINLGYAD